MATGRRIIFLLFGVAAATLLLLLIGYNANARVVTIPAARVQSASGLGSYQLAPSAIFTDVFDTAASNNTQIQASDIGAGKISCSSPIAATNLTFYRGDISPPSSDIDWYKFTASAQFFYTITVKIQVASDLNISMRLRDPNNNEPFGQQTSQNHLVTFYALSGGVYSFQLNTIGGITDTENKPYEISLCSSESAATPTPSPTSTSTAVAGSNPDAYEPNDTIAEAAAQVIGPRTIPSFIAVGARLDNLSFTPYADRPTDTDDWFEFYGREGSIYQITTLNVQPGVETVVSVYKPVADVNAPTLVLVTPMSGSSNPNNRFQSGQRGSQVTFKVPSSSNGSNNGMYWVRIQNIDPSFRVPGQTYTLQVQETLVATATPGPSPTTTSLPPTVTPYPGLPDKFEYNGRFEDAALLAPNVKYDALNFVPFQPPSQNTFDNDFYRLSVKQGIFYTCQTLDLAPGVDTNLIIYNQDRVGIGGNDDISVQERSLGNFSSRLSWLASYTGNVFILVGEVNPPRANEAGGHTYSMRCDIGLPATATPSAQSSVVAATAPPAVPQAPEPSMTPFPTPRTAQNLPVRPVSSINATATPQPTATPRIIQLTVQVFNDVNRNGLLDTGEGISGASVRVSDEASGIPLAQSQTDADGRVSISISNPGAVRLSVPLFGYSLLVNETELTVRIAIITAINMPVRIP